METNPISEIGEIGLIDRIQPHFLPQQPDTILGIGDDAAIVSHPDSQPSVITTDMLCEGVHFDLSYTPLKHLGYKAVSVNISDIVAMNAQPKQILVSLGLSSRFTIEAVDELYKGIKTACERYSVDLIGGDTVSSRSGLTISVTAIGEANEENIVRRSTAQQNDLLCVSGDLGAAYLGLQIMEREKQVFLTNPDMQPNLEAHEYIVMRQLKPEARIDITQSLKEKGIVPTSMIDISDGLASELLHLCKASKLGALIYEKQVPIERDTFTAATDVFKMAPITCALNGGEDYELLFTVKQEDLDKIRELETVSVIGFMRHASEGVTMQSSAGQVIQVEAQGWGHFGKEESPSV